MKIFITNLPWSKDRRRHMERQFEKNGLPHSFVDCVIGSNLTSKQIEENCDVETINKHNQKIAWFNKGIIGCTITNQNTYRTIIEQDIDAALLLEDDTILPKNLPSLLRDIEKFIQQGDVVLLFYMSWSQLQLQPFYYKSEFGFNYYIPLNPEVISGGSAFIVTKEAATKMLKQNTPIHTTPDSWGYFKDNKSINRLIICHPTPVDTADFKSTMGHGKLRHVREIIDKYKIFPFYKFLKYRRRLMKRKKQNINIVGENNSSN